MTKKSFSKILMLALVVGVFGVLHSAYAAFEGVGTTTGVSNVSPTFTGTPSDGGSNNGSGTYDTKGNPTKVGSNVTFTGTAHDINSDAYYLAVCKTDAVAAGDNAAPTCPGEAWGVSAETVNDAQASKTYTALVGDAESNNWYAFVCDKISGGGACYPANAAGDKGFAWGKVTFADVPADTNTITIDSKIYEFDTAGGCGGEPTNDVCVNVTAAEDGTQTAVALAAAETGVNTHMTSRGAVTYVYADVQGVGGNAYGMVIGTCPNCSVNGATLAGGDDDNKMPFYVDHAGTFGTVTFTDSSDGVTIEPDETIKFKLANDQIADPDSNGGQDTFNVYICSGESDMGGITTAFDYTANTCTNGTLLCSDTAVNPSSGDATCNDTTNSVSVPTAHGTYDVMVYVEDNHNLPATGTALQTFTVVEVPPVLTEYTVEDIPLIAAGGDDEYVFSLTLADDNGDMDVTNVKGVFFNSAAAANTCTADENNCYIAPTCVLSDRGPAGSNKTAYGADKDLTATCTVTIYFNTDESDEWEVNAKATDDVIPDPDVVTTFADTNVNVEIAPLQGIDIVQTSIVYGTVIIGGTSEGQETSMGNVGNQVIDVIVNGSKMCNNYPACGEKEIAAAQQKWHSTNGTFDWDASASDPGPWVLLVTSSGTDEAGGCLNRDMAVRAVAAATTENESIWWKIRVPATQAAGSYTGANTFTSTSDTTCSTASAH